MKAKKDDETRFQILTKIWSALGRGGGQVASVLAFYSNDCVQIPLK